MKMEDLRTAYYESSRNVSTINRQIGYAFIAVIWIFCQFDGMSIKVPSELILPLSLVVGSLIFDFLQYVISTIVWGSYHRFNERKGINEKTEFRASKFINWPQNLFFILKVVIMIFAANYLLIFLISKSN